MKRVLIIIILWCGAGVLAASAQRRTFLKFNPTTLPNELDVYLSHELTPTLTLETGGGFVYTDYWDNVLNQFDFGQIKPNVSEHQYLNAKGYAARLGLRFYVISPYTDNARASGTYFEPLLLFKEVWYPHDDKELDSKNYIERGRKYVSGLQLLVGRQYKKKNIYIDKYVGLGVKAKTYRFDNYQLNNGNGDVENNGTRTTSWLPSIHLGVKIAFDLSRKHGAE